MILYTQFNLRVLILFGLILVVLFYFLFTKLSKVNQTNVSNTGIGNVSGKSTLYFCVADWCGHCQRFKPEMQKCLNDQELNGLVNMRVVKDTDTKDMKHLGVQGFPTILLDTGGELKKYDGNRTLEEIRDFVRTKERSVFENFSNNACTKNKENHWGCSIRAPYRTCKKGQCRKGFSSHNCNLAGCECKCDM